MTKVRDCRKSDYDVPETKRYKPKTDVKKTKSSCVTNKHVDMEPCI